METLKVKKRSKKSKSNLPIVLPKGSSLPVPSKRVLDPLQRYLHEISRYSILPPEEQVELARKFKKTGDVKYAKALVTSNLRLVVKIAMEYRHSYQNMLDLIQEGNVGLMKAVSNYDPYRGTRLSYYASWWIRSYILKFLIDNFRLVKIGTTQAQKKLFYNLMREKRNLEARGIPMAPALLAEKLDVKESEVSEMDMRMSSSGHEISIDQPFKDGGDGEGGSLSPKDFLKDNRMLADDQLAQDQIKEILLNHVSTFHSHLNEKERAIFQLRLLSESPQTLQQIATVFGISRERARQIEVRVIEKLRKHLKGHMEGLPAPKKSKKK